MSATIRITCYHGAPEGWEHVSEFNRRFRPPYASIDGRETQLQWDRPTDIEVPSGQPMKLQVLMRLFDFFGVCGAEVEVEPLQDGDVLSYEYRIEWLDRLLNRGHLTRRT